METLLTINPVILALIAGIFTWSMTLLGSSLVFLNKNYSQNFLNNMMALAAGVMVAASFYSLLNPAYDYALEFGSESPLFIVVFGFVCGGIMLYLFNRFIPHEHNYVEGENPSTKRSAMMLFSAITIHNIPEGLAVGVAFGALSHEPTMAVLLSAIALATGIGIQNFPEGSAVTFPIYEHTKNRKTAFFWGQASAIVEPIAAAIGALLVIQMQAMLPFLLALAAGAMLYVVAEELIPNASKKKTVNNIVALWFIFGFAIMMTLDIALS